ncbi:MAG: hypothetical protein ACFFDU_03820 [Candidatus Thorarchaeota archaeon]
MAEQPPDDEKNTEKPNKNERPSSEGLSKDNGIVILQERDIPFEEERPPNFSPHYSVTVHHVRKESEKEDQEE